MAKTCLTLQVSVRRAGMQAAARLLKEVPSEKEVARLWVRAVLPMVSFAPLLSTPLNTTRNYWHRVR